MSASTFLNVCLILTFLMVSAAFILIIIRVIRGPTLPDRILGLDLLVNAAVGFIVAFGIRTGFSIYVDIAIALGLVGFLSTVALARFVHKRGDVSMGRPQAESKGEGA